MVTKAKTNETKQKRKGKRACSLQKYWLEERRVLGCKLSSAAQSCLTLCDTMDCTMPGLPVHHQLPGLTQIHVHRVGDAIQPFHPLLSPSPPTLNHSQHQGLFK